MNQLPRRKLTGYITNELSITAIIIGAAVSLLD